MDIKKQLDDLGIVPDEKKDQFFLTNDSLVKEMIDLARLEKNDVVLEIGAGTGVLTREIAKHVGKVITFEFDRKFKPFLKKLPKNVEVHYQDAWDFVQLHGKFTKRKEYNKVISNISFSFCEKFLHNLTFLIYDKVILLVPLKFVKSIEDNGIFSSFFVCDLKETVSRKNFYPVPRTNSAIIDLLKLPDPLKEKNPGRYLRQYMYQHEGQKVKNSLREGIIKFYRLADDKTVTKKEAKKIINAMGISQSLSDSPPNDMSVYFLVASYFSKG